MSYVHVRRTPAHQLRACSFLKTLLAEPGLRIVSEVDRRVRAEGDTLSMRSSRLTASYTRVLVVANETTGTKIKTDVALTNQFNLTRAASRGG